MEGRVPSVPRRRSISVALALVCALVCLRLQLLAYAAWAIGGGAPSSVAAPSPFAAVLPCTIKDRFWLVAKVLSCNRTLDTANVRLVLVVAPGFELAKLAAFLVEEGVALPPHWHLISEEDVLPRLPGRGANAPRTPGWILQQIIKLCARHHPLVTEARPPIRYILTLDSDVVCALEWADRVDYAWDEEGMRAPQTLAPERHVRTLADVFVAPDGRILTCVEQLAGWYGEVHLHRTALSWNFSVWLGEDLSVHPKLLGSHVMGWTPQILSVAALDEMEAEIVRRVPMPLDPPSAQDPRGPRDGGRSLYRRLVASDWWTEYFTYFLSLDSRGRWHAYHANLCAEWQLSHLEPASGRCGSQFCSLKHADPDRALPRPADLHMNSSAVPGCLKVRVDCGEELALELARAVVPFITVNDHDVGARQTLRVVRRELAAGEDVNVWNGSRTYHYPAEPCCYSYHVLPGRSMATAFSTSAGPGSGWLPVVKWSAEPCNGYDLLGFQGLGRTAWQVATGTPITLFTFAVVYLYMFARVSVGRGHVRVEVIVPTRLTGWWALVCGRGVFLAPPGQAVDYSR